METLSDNGPVEIFAGTPWQAEMVKNLLENEGINAYIKDEILGTLNPWWAAPGGAGGVKVTVSGLDVVKALRIVKEYEKNL